MISIDISGITYECDGTNLLARVGDAAYGPSPLSSALRIGDGSVYITLGVLHVVLTGQAFDILSGIAPVPVPETTSVTSGEEEQVIPTASSTKRSRKK